MPALGNSLGLPFDAPAIDATPGGATNVFLNEDDTGELNEDATFSLPEG